MTRFSDLSPAKRALLERALAARQAAERPSRTIPRRLGGEAAPLSFAQQRMWFLSEWEPGAPTFNGARAFRLRGPLDADALEHAFATVIDRHESLRTVFRADAGQPRQVVLDPWAFALERISGLSGDLGEYLRERSREPFDLSADLMLRASLTELGLDDHVLLIRMHHIAADAHSDRVLFSELEELYDAYRSGRNQNLPALPIQYADYAVWQRERLSGVELERLSAYWARTLTGAPPLVDLPTDRPRRPVQRHSGSHHRFTCSAAAAERLTAVGREQGATFFITMLAAFAVLLSRLSGQEDIVIGGPIASRDHDDLAALIGFFTNTIAFRVRLDGDPSFREAASRARTSALGAYAHHELPFEKVVETLRPKRNPSYHPLFQVNFRAHDGRRPEPALADLHAERIPIDIGFSRFDLALELELGPDELAGYFEYDEDLFDLRTVTSFVAGLEAVLEQAGADPDRPISAIELPEPPSATGRSTARGSIPRRRT